MKFALFSLVLLLSHSVVRAEKLFAISASSVPVGMPLPEALKVNGRSGFYRLPEGYQGEIRTVARAGVAAKVGKDFEESCEFTHFAFDDRGVGGAFKPAFTIEALERGSTCYLSATRVENLPTIDRLKSFKRISDFQRVFGQSRSMTDAWGDFSKAIHSSIGWTGFTLQSDESVRVVSVFLHTLGRNGVWSIEGAHFREGIFKPTGRAPRVGRR